MPPLATIHAELRRHRVQRTALWCTALVLLLFLAWASYPTVSAFAGEGRHGGALARLALPLGLALVVWGPAKRARRRFERLRAYRTRLLRQSAGQRPPAAAPPAGVHRLRPPCANPSSGAPS